MGVCMCFSSTVPPLPQNWNLLLAGGCHPRPCDPHRHPVQGPLPGPWCSDPSGRPQVGPDRLLQSLDPHEAGHDYKHGQEGKGKQRQVWYARDPLRPPPAPHPHTPEWHYTKKKIYNTKEDYNIIQVCSTSILLLIFTSDIYLFLGGRGAICLMRDVLLLLCTILYD